MPSKTTSTSLIQFEKVCMFILCPSAPQGVKWEPPKEIDNVLSLEGSYVAPQHPESTQNEI